MPSVCFDLIKSKSHPSPTPSHGNDSPAFWSHHLLAFLFVLPHMSASLKSVASFVRSGDGVLLYTFLSVWLLSFEIFFVRFIHWVCRVIGLFTLMTVSYSILLIYSSVSCQHLWVSVLFPTLICTLWGHVICLCSALVAIAKHCSTAEPLLHMLPPSVFVSFVALHPHLHLILSHFLAFVVFFTIKWYFIGILCNTSLITTETKTFFFHILLDCLYFFSNNVYNIFAHFSIKFFFFLMIHSYFCILDTNCLIVITYGAHVFPQFLYSVWFHEDIPNSTV